MPLRLRVREQKERKEIGTTQRSETILENYSELIKIPILIFVKAQKSQGELSKNKPIPKYILNLQNAKKNKIKNLSPKHPEEKTDFLQTNAKVSTNISLEGKREFHTCEVLG